MADIRLAKPAAGTTQTVPSAPDGRFIFDFPADAATLTRNGDDLVLTFEDGAAIQLQGFYTTYSKEEMPSFQVDGVEISGQDFFAALDEDLMPAAGPASGSSAARGGRYNEYGGSDLLDGLDHLGRLDIGFDGGTQLATDTVEPSPYSEVDHGVTVTPSGVGAATEVVTVYEAGLEGGSQAGEKDAPTMARGSLSINAPDGVASIVIGGVVVFENGALTGKVVSTDEGTLSVTGYDPATGKLDFSYSLDRNTTEHVKGDPDTDTQISHTLVVTVTDTDGDSGSTTITVNVVDDMPEARADSISFTEAEAQKGASGESVLENDVFGADAPADKMVTSVNDHKPGETVSGTYGELTLNADGTYTYKLGDKVDVPNGETYTEEFTYTIKDADGDTSTATLTITIEGDKIVPANPGSATIVVDEALLPDGNVVNSDNSDHKPSGTGSFTVNLNGEDGTVTLKYGSGPDAPNITLSLINGEDFSSEWLSHNTTLTVNGVEVTVTGATQQDDGSWKIEYSYSLTGQQTHTGQGVGENDALSGIIGITVTDATGDTSTGSLTVTVHDDGPVLSDVVAEASQIVDTQSTISLDFSGLSVGADSEGATLTVEVNGTTFTGTQDGAGKWNFTSTDAKDGEAFAMGTDGQFIYTRPKEDTAGEANNSYTFNVTVTDADEDAVSDSVTVTTVVKPGFEGQPSEGSVVDSLVTDDSGLAGGNVSDPDGSGDATSAQDTGSFSVTLNGREYTITLTGKEDSFTLKLDAAGNLKDSVSLDGVELEGNYGTLSNISVSGGTISYTYTQTVNYFHDADGNNRDAAAPGADSFGVTVSDGLNDDVSGTISVTIEDDGPVLSDVVAEASQIVDTQSTISLDFSGLSVGADSEGATLTVEVNGTTFTGTQDGAGKWNFTSTDAKDGEAFAMGTDGQFIYTRPKEDTAGEANNSYTFNVTVTDADEDAVSDSVTVTTVVKPGFEGQPSEGSVVDSLVTDDSGLAGGNVSDPDGSGDATSAQDTGSFSVTLNGREYTITLTGKEDSFTLKLDAAGNLKDSVSLDGVELEGNYGTLSNISVSGGTISYTYTQTVNYFHDADGNNRDAAAPGADSFGVTVSDGLNDDVSGTISVTIEDDGPVISTDTTSGSSLTVDESYADNVAGPGLELEESANTDTVSLDVSNLFSVDAGADGEAGREFALSISNNGQTGQKVLVGGSQYDLTLVQNIDGSISGVAGDENGTVIFKITISNDGNVTLDMTGYGSLVHPHGGSTAEHHDETVSITGVEVTLTVTDTDGDSDSASTDLVLTFEDDGPGLTVTTDEVPDAPDTPVNNLGSGEAFSFVPDTPEKPDASDYEEGEDDPNYQTALQKYNTAITAAKQEAEGMAGQSVESGILSKNGWEGVSIYAGKVTYNADGTVDQLTSPSDYCLKYSDYASNSFTVDNKPAADWGIMVASPDDDNESWADDNYETNVIDGNASEAIVIDLGGQLAYGIELSFGAFYSNYKGTEGAEKLLITFYKGSEIVESRFVDSVDIGSSNTGKVTYSTDLIAGGFDKVVVSAVLGENDRESSFTLQGVDFVTAPLAIAVASGELDVASGADGYAEDFAVANVQFAMEQMFTLQDDGTYSLSILDGNNDSKSAIVTVIIDDLGNSRLTATVDGKELFSATLEKDGGSWSWKMEQYQEFLVQGKDGQLGNLELGFITMDGDDDTATETVNIPLKNLPDLAVSQTTLVTDESYINGLGSETGPAGGDDGQANSARASGTMSVNTYGKEGELILTIDGKVFVFQLDADGKLSGTSEELAVTTTYGTLTLTNGEAGKITYTYTQTQPYSHTPGEGPDQSSEAESFTVQVKADGEMSDPATITVSIEDDAPMFSDESFTVDVAKESQKYWSYAQEISFTDNEIANHFDGKNEVTMQYGDNKLTLQVGKIQFGADGNIDTSKDCATFIDGQGTFFINGQNQDLGIGVHSNYTGGIDNSECYQYHVGRQNEIGYDPISNQSEAVIIRLDKPAVNMSIDLSSFYDIGGADANPEEAIFLFYKDGEYVGKSHLSSDEASGDVQQNGFSALPPGGFDTVVIAAGDNGTDPATVWDNSEFNISAITFNKFEGVDRTLTGQLEATSADGIKGYSVDTDTLANLELKSDDMPIRYGWNEDTGRLLAKAGDATVFELVLNTETGAWTMVQYKEYEGELELPFTATDGDDDSTSISVAIPATGAESGTYKVTDSDAEKAVLAAAEQEMKSAVRSGEALATAAVLAGMATVLPDEVPAVEGDRPDTPDETLVAAPAEAADAPAALSFFEEGAALPDSPVEGMDDTPLLFANLALAGQEELMVSAAQTDAADGPLWADASGTDDTSGTVVGETATAGPDAAHAGTAAPEAVLHGTDGDDILLGGDGDELIFGGSGDDYIDGGEGRDTIYAGDGNDIIVYDSNDYLVSGGSGIDFMVSDDSTLTLTTLLSGGKNGHEGPIVDSIEVLLKGDAALSLTSIQELADKYGIELGTNPAGQETLTLDMGKWTEQADGSYDFNGDADLTLETNLQHDSDASSDNGEMAQQVFILEHTNS